MYPNRVVIRPRGKLGDITAVSLAMRTDIMTFRSGTRSDPKHGSFFHKQHHSYLQVVCGITARLHSLQWGGAAIPDTTRVFVSEGLKETSSLLQKRAQLIRLYITLSSTYLKGEVP